MTATRPQHTEETDTVKETLRSRAADLTPHLAERAQAIDDARRLPPEIVELLHDAELLNAAKPWRFGGSGEYDALLAATYELGRGSGSVAWCHAVWTQHNWMLGLWPEEMQLEYFGATPNAVCSSAFNPGGARVGREAGGYRVGGQWAFASGCDNAQWYLLGAMLPEGEVGYIMVPEPDAEIVDTWFVSGLKGTGSKDILVHDVFVPQHRVVTGSSLAEPRPAGQDRPSCTLPTWPLVLLSLTYAVMGMGRGALDAFEDRLRSGAKSIAGVLLAEDAPTELRLSEAATELDCAMLLCERSIADMLDHARRNDPATMSDRLRWARDRAYASRLSVQAVNRLFDASGASGLYETSPIQRFHRDVHAGSHQPAHIWDVLGVHWARDRVGAEALKTRRLV
jgi:alkylation response protein AidB-like acyl-CoA dehydrogenase